jgi:hypothetical protein
MGRLLAVRQGGGFGPGGLGSSVQQGLVDSGQQMWVGDQGVTSPVPWGYEAPVKPQVAPEVGIMPQPVIPEVALPVRVYVPRPEVALPVRVYVPRPEVALPVRVYVPRSER